MLQSVYLESVLRDFYFQKIKNLESKILIHL